MTERYVRAGVMPRETRSPQQRFAEATLAVCRSLVGTQEIGRNGGPAVEQFLRFVGIHEPSPWCTAVACWALNQAALAIGARGDTCPDFPSGAKLWRWALRHPLECVLVDVDRIRPGDVVVMGSSLEKARRIRRGRLASGHTMIAASAVTCYGPLMFDTYEGNTNPQGHREGQGFYARKRNWTDARLVGAIRFRPIF